MMIVSLYDLKQLDKFKNIPDEELLKVKYDEEVLNEAYTIGLDDTCGYRYEFCLHRPLSSKTPILGYVLRGEVRKDDEFRKSPAYTPELQMLSTMRKDVSLTRELASMSGVSFDYGKVLDEDSEKWESEDSFEPNHDDTAEYISYKNSVVLAIRGYPMNDWGTLKIHAEWLKG